MAKTSADLTADAWYIMAPLVGILGTFVSGSATVSDIMFGAFQFSTASQIGISKTAVLALQAVGGAAGNMICIHNVVAALTVVGLVGKEGLVIKRNFWIVILYGLLSGVLVWLIAVFFLPNLY